MSSDNNSGGSKTPLILLVIFLLIAAVSWFFFSNTQGDVNEAKQDLASKISDNIETGADDEGHEGHDHGDSHNHGATTSTDGEIGVAGKVYELNQPAIYGTRGVGNPDAPVKIQEFFSLTCNHCAEFHKDQYQEIKKNLIDTGKVYFVYEEFPLNGPALYGSMIARCLPKERYAGFIDILLRTQDKWAFSGDFKDSLKQNAKLAGMSEQEFETCFANTELQKAVGANIKEASDVWKVNSTPSFVINNGERILYGGQTYKTFEKLVAQLTSGSAKAPAFSSDNAMKAIDAVKETATDVGSDIKDDAANLGGDLMDAGKDAIDAASDAAESSSDAIQDGADAVTDTMKKAVE